MISKVIGYLRPGSQHSLVGQPTSAEEYASALAWYGPGEAPTWQEIQAAVALVTVELQNEQARLNRQAAFTAEADPLFFGWQRGENTEQAWLDKCEEIRQRFPYVTPAS